MAQWQVALLSKESIDANEFTLTGNASSVVWTQHSWALLCLLFPPNQQYAVKQVHGARSHLVVDELSRKLKPVHIMLY